MGEFPIPPAFPFGIDNSSGPSTGSSNMDDKPVMFGASSLGNAEGYTMKSNNGAEGLAHHFPRGMIDNVEMRPVSRVHSAALEKDPLDTMVPIINEHEAFCDTLAVRLRDNGHEHSGC